ncbi:hypothetical protein DFJ73DRAFT_799710 [Zopfochytrium polystomum]|nr:hypothetical protein DFJ73DRAFT_799710 [Zopfochytrium polystomum]
MTSSPSHMDPAVLAVLIGVYLSRKSPLRVLQRDRDTVVLLISTLRAIRAHHIDWTEPGVWPAIARIEFPPPLVKGFPMARATAADGNDEFYPDMVSGYDFYDRWFLEGAERRIAEHMWTRWKDLEAWAFANGHVKPADVAAVATEDDFTFLGSNQEEKSPGGQQLLIEALGDLVEPFHVNMLPIKMGMHDSLPVKCKRYSSLVNRCLSHCPKERFQVGYLTIHEGWVEPGESQRRPGLHIESPGYYTIDDDTVNDSGVFKRKLHNWGFGIGPNIWHIEGGVFQASNLANTCRVWNCIIRDHGDIVGPLGDIEHLRHSLNNGPPPSLPDYLPHANPPDNSAWGVRTDTPLVRRPREGETLEANAIAWMTDRTPHESVPIGGGGGRRRVFRQYFRLVTSRVTAWYEAHSTRNDECDVRPPDSVVIVRGDKFEAASAAGGKPAAPGSSGAGNDAVRPLPFI